MDMSEVTTGVGRVLLLLCKKRGPRFLGRRISIELLGGDFGLQLLSRTRGLGI